MSVRVRLGVAVLTAGVVAAGGMVMERRLEPRVPPPPAGGADFSGAWFCPHGGGEGWRAWVTVANPSARPTEIRLTTWVGRTPREAAEILPPGAHRTVEVPAGQPAAATAVEFVGAPAAAGMVVTRPAELGGGVAAEPCAEQAGTRWYVPEASTLRGETSLVVLHNPFAVDAVADVGLIAGNRLVRPGRLKGIVLNPGQARAIDLGRFALGEESLAAAISVPLGRVVAGGVTSSAGGLRATLAVPEPSRRWIIPGGGDGSGILLVTAPGEEAAPIHARAYAAEAESALVDLETVPAGTVLALDEGARDAGVVVEADGPAPILAARRLAAAVPPPEPPSARREGQGGGRQGDRRKEEEPPPPPPPDLAASAGVPVPGTAWLVLPPVPPGSGGAVILVENPGFRAADVEVTPLGTDGPGEPLAVTVPPRSTVRVDLPQPAAADVRASTGSVVAAGAALGAATYAVAAGIRLA